MKIEAISGLGRFAFLICLCPLCTACVIQWRTGDLENIERLKPALEGAWRPAVTYRSEPDSDSSYGGSFASIARQCGWFASVRRYDPHPDPRVEQLLHPDFRVAQVPGDLHLAIRVVRTDSSWNDVSPWWCIGTLFVIPAFAKYDYTLEAEVRRSDGKEAKYTFETGECTLAGWVALPLLPFFLDPVGDSLDSLIRHLFLSLRRDGFLTED